MPVLVLGQGLRACSPSASLSLRKQPRGGAPAAFAPSFGKNPCVWPRGGRFHHGWHAHANGSEPRPGDDSYYSSTPKKLGPDGTLEEDRSETAQQRGGLLASAKNSFQVIIGRMDGLWVKFIPMVSLFFCMAFINTIVDNMKDTIVITAVGSGPSVIPFLTAYGTLPAAFLFLILFSAASQRFRRHELFNGVVFFFLVFFTSFAWILYPSHETLHLYHFGDKLRQILPIGLSGLVAMVQNWTFTLFYIAAELWGDVGLSLLFWGLANEITSHDEAPLLYPLFGVGANVAQVIAGQFLNAIGGAAEVVSFTNQQRIILTAASAVGVMVLAIHKYVCSLDLEGEKLLKDNLKQRHAPARKKKIIEKKKKLSLKQSVAFLMNSPQIRCLAIMALAQGICTNLMDVTWKTHLRMLYPSPTEYAAAMGNVASLCGVVTGLLMMISPLLFKRLGWGGTAGATPAMLLAGGVPFFVVAIFYNAVGIGAGFGPALLQGLVFIGAILYVVCRGAKFSLFKPAEEMVYIDLDVESRTKGKAAIDVVGAQTGKALSSGLQQLLLLIGGGRVALMLPFMAVTFVAFLTQWQRAVKELATHFMDPPSPEEKDWHGITVDEEMLDSASLKEIDKEIAAIVNRRDVGTDDDLGSFSARTPA